MYDSKNDFALNKLDPKAIVCRSATGVHIRLTQTDFTSEEEFDRWKKWSDGDYYDTIRSGRDFYDNCIPLEETWNTTGVSAEDAFFIPLLKAEQEQQRAALLQQIKSLLTKMQYRRLWMHIVNGLSVEQIALHDNVSHQSISQCLALAWKRIANNL